jgi:hypothetical protein
MIAGPAARNLDAVFRAPAGSSGRIRIEHEAFCRLPSLTRYEVSLTTPPRGMLMPVASLISGEMP